MPKVGRRAYTPCLRESGILILDEDTVWGREVEEYVIMFFKCLKDPHGVKSH